MILHNGAEITFIDTYVQEILNRTLSYMSALHLIKRWTEIPLQTWSINMDAFLSHMCTLYMMRQCVKIFSRPHYLETSCYGNGQTCSGELHGVELDLP